MTRSIRRENVPVTQEEQSLLELLLEPGTAEHAALVELAGDVGSSRAAVAHAVLALGIDSVRAKVREAGYAALAESFTSEERDERRAESHSRRERGADRWAGE
jgi:hypothetical protein